MTMKKFNHPIILTILAVFFLSIYGCDFFKGKKEDKTDETKIMNEKLSETDRKIELILSRITEIEKHIEKAGLQKKTDTANEALKKTEEIPEEKTITGLDVKKTDTEIHENKSGKILPLTDNKTLPDEKPKESAVVIYKKAMEAYKAKNFDAAAELFNKMTVHFAETDLADNSFYWKGESLYELKKYTEAIEAYNHVAENYPDSEKAPSSMLKIGYAFMAMNKNDEAREYFRKTVATYPFTQPGTVAQSMLEKMKP